MTLEELNTQILTMNESELFYKQYYEASKSKKELDIFLKKLDWEKIRRLQLLVPEEKNTIPPMYLEDWFFDEKSKSNIFISKHNWYTPALVHKHTFFECIYLVKGEFTQVVSNFSLHMKAGDLCLIPPGVFHQINVFDESIILLDILIRKTTFEDIFFNFLRSDNILSLFFLNNLYSNHMNDYILFHTGKDEYVKSLIMAMFLECINNKAYSAELLNSLLLVLFVTILRKYESNCELPPLVKRKSLLIFGLLQFIQDNYMKVTLNMVAQKFNYTPEYTSKLIKSTTGYTFIQILQHIKMQRAEKLLRDTNISVGDISVEVGYLNPEHFIRMFKKQYKVTPSEYRKNNIRN